MNATRLKQIESVYHEVAEGLRSDAEMLLDMRCGDDEDLRSEVRSLLSCEGVFDSFIDGAVDAIAADLFAEDDAEEILGKTVRHYRIVRMVGEGGMGKIYLAEDTRLDRKVALKVLPPDLIERRDRLKRFKQEAKAASALNHPNILTIHEFGTYEDSNYIVTEFVDGVTLRQKIRDGLSIRETLDIAEQAASALTAAHGAGIIHRDIKPENIMIRRDGILKVLDFGLAKLSMPSGTDPANSGEAQTLFRTEPGMVVGTANYMSPEQARGLTVDGRTDIWSLGVIIYEMVTGELPFDGPTQADTLAAILNQPVPMIENHIDTPAELTRIIEKTLAKNASERYRNVEELAFDLKRLRHRLESQTERSGDPHRTDDERGRNRETSTRTMPAAVAGAQENPGAGVPANKSINDRSRLYFMGSIILVIAAAGIFGAIVWQYARPEPVARSLADIPGPPRPPVHAADPSHSLVYSLTVQSFTDGRYKEPFALSGEMLFRNRDRIRLNIKSPQSGHLYILNQGPESDPAKVAYNILFPSPTANDGLARLSAGQEIRIPEQSWFELDTKEGTEFVWLVWSVNAVPELESAKRFANVRDRGRIGDAQLTDAIGVLLRRHQADKTSVERDDDKKETQITGNADIVAHLIKLEHH